MSVSFQRAVGLTQSMPLDLNASRSLGRSINSSGHKSNVVRSKYLTEVKVPWCACIRLQIAKPSHGGCRISYLLGLDFAGGKGVPV